MVHTVFVPAIPKMLLHILFIRQITASVHGTSVKGNMHAAQNGMGFSTPDPELQDVRDASSKMKISQYRILD